MTGPNPNRPLDWHHDQVANVWIARSDDGGRYRVIYSSGGYHAVYGAVTIGYGSSATAAKNTAQAHHNAARAARDAANTVVPTAQLIAAMRGVVSVAYANLNPGPAVAVAAAIESVAEAVGIDPAILRSETRP